MRAKGWRVLRVWGGRGSESRYTYMLPSRDKGVRLSLCVFVCARVGDVCVYACVCVYG